MSSIRNWISDKWEGADFDQAPSKMNNYEFNRWAEMNPTEAAGLGATGYEVNANNLGGSQYLGSLASGSNAGTPTTAGLSLASSGLATLTGLGNLALGYKQYGLAKDALAHNIMDSNRQYDAAKTQYNNSLARTAAVDKHYGSATAGTKVG